MWNSDQQSRKKTKLLNKGFRENKIGRNTCLLPLHWLQHFLKYMGGVTFTLRESNPHQHLSVRVSEWLNHLNRTISGNLDSWQLMAISLSISEWSYGCWYLQKCNTHPSKSTPASVGENDLSIWCRECQSDFTISTACIQSWELCYISYEQLLLNMNVISLIYHL